MIDPSSADARLEKLATQLVPHDPDLAASIRWQIGARRGETDGSPPVPPEQWFEHVLRLPESLHEPSLTTLADQSDAAFLPFTLAAAAGAPLPYHRVFALKRLPRFRVPEVRALLERLHREGKGPDYGPYFATVLDEIDPVWAKGVLASPSAAPPPRPRAPDPEDEDWIPDSAGHTRTFAILAVAAASIALSAAWALHLLPEWPP